MHHSNNKETFKRIAIEKGGRCLSNTYINSQTKLKWECKNGHIWEARPNDIKRGQWCKKCADEARSLRKRKIGLKEVKQYASSKNGKCISKTYVGAHKPLSWECEFGHQWTAAYSSMKHRNSWCPHCSNRAKHTIEQMREIAQKKGGKCLSNTYINSQTKLKWKCKNGHIWEAIPNAIIRGQWCKKCADNERSIKRRQAGLIEVQEFAKSKKGKCISTEYKGAHSPLTWECEKGHQWTTFFSSIKHGNTWCPHCSNRAKLTIDQMQELARKKGGKCLSIKYVNIDTKLLWQCKEGHKWESIPYLIKNGSWCPQCNVIKRSRAQRSSIEDMTALAKSRGGKCISKTYTNSQTPLTWECNNGHQWKAKPMNIKKGTWCPICSAGLGERICREHFEQLFKTDFPKSYPDWLTNENKNQMELDGLCASLKLAFEHQGGQHYYIDGFFIKTNEQLKRRKRDDELKKQLCNDHGIALIRVPEIPKHLKLENLKQFIKEQCKSKGIALTKQFDHTEIDLLKAYTPTDTLAELEFIATEKGGKCLSDGYYGSQINLLWECGIGHRWQAVPNRIKQGGWCPYCAGIMKLTIQQMRELAQKRQGKCLSDKYINNRTALLWQCKEGHQWKAKPDNIKSGTWCPICRIKERADSQRSSIAEMRSIAKRRNGKCISKEYKSTHFKLTWECEFGHQWEAVPSAVKRGSWCPTCSGKAKPSIEDIRKIAADRKGKCLSEKYISTHTKLLWECEKGHQWEARPSGIKRGAWCPVCSGNVKLSIKDMQQIAKEKGGKCLSEKYINIDTKLLWECQYGHQWETIPYIIRSGSWCPICARKNRKKADNYVKKKQA